MANDIQLGWSGFAVIPFVAHNELYLHQSMCPFCSVFFCDDASKETGKKTHTSFHHHHHHHRLVTNECVNSIQCEYEQVATDESGTNKQHQRIKR